MFALLLQGPMTSDRRCLLDPVLFEQVLFNLLDNAAKYTPGGTAIRLSASRDGDAVVVRIVDEGGGIPEDEAEKVFEKFYRARKGDSVRAGTGLGLAISRGFIEAMGGTIEARNRTDRRGAAYAANMAAINPPRASSKKSTSTSLPSLPLLQPSFSQSRLPPIAVKPSSSSVPHARKSNSLTGVKLKKHKDTT